MAVSGLSSVLIALLSKAPVWLWVPLGIAGTVLAFVLFHLAGYAVQTWRRLFGGKSSEPESISSEHQFGGFTGVQTAQTITNNFAPSPLPVAQFLEGGGIAPIISLGCLNVAPMGKLLSDMMSGMPTPLLVFRNQESGTEVALLSAFIRDATLYVDVVLPSETTGVAFMLQNNVESICNPSWDRNYTDRALEVVNEDGFPVLQLVRVGKRNIAITGVFLAFGMAIAIAPGQFMRRLSSIAEAQALLSDSAVFPKLFEYPSWQHQGRLLSPPLPRPICPPHTLGRMSAITRCLEVLNGAPHQSQTP